MDNLLAWGLLAGFAVVMVVIDLGFAGKGDGPMTFRSSLTWSIIWFVAGIGFFLPTWYWLDHTRGQEYLAGYLLERSLSLDNVFVFALIFAAFAVPHAVRQTALMWGILGALVLRVVLIVAGIALIEALHWVMYIFGALLVGTGIKMALTDDEDEVDLDRNRTLKLIRRVFPMTSHYDGRHLFTQVDGKRVATPLVAVLGVIATTDIIFAVDSIPAIFAVTTDPFVVVAANVLALAGLRSLYFLLEGMLGAFRFLQPALALLLVIIGVKLLTEELYHPPIWATLLIVVVIVGGGIVLSLLFPDKEAERLLAEVGDDAEEEIAAVVEGGPGDARPRDTRE